MYFIKDLISIFVSKNPIYKKNRVLFIIKEYIIVVTKELLKGNEVEFPNEFGSAKVVTKKMNPIKLKALIYKKKEIIDYFYDTKLQLKIPSADDYAMKRSVSRLFITKLEYVLKNKLKVYPYVDQ